jgi:hypothetical protein
MNNRYEGRRLIAAVEDKNFLGADRSHYEYVTESFLSKTKIPLISRWRGGSSKSIFMVKLILNEDFASYFPFNWLPLLKKVPRTFWVMYKPDSGVNNRATILERDSDVSCWYLTPLGIGTAMTSIVGVALGAEFGLWSKLYTLFKK